MSLSSEARISPHHYQNCIVGHHDNGNRNQGVQFITLEILVIIEALIMNINYDTNNLQNVQQIYCTC